MKAVLGMWVALTSYFQLMVTRPKIDLRKDSGSVHLIEQILDLREGVLILDGHIIKLTVICT